MLTFNHGLQLGNCVEFILAKMQSVGTIDSTVCAVVVELHELKTDIPSRTIQQVGYFPP